MAKFLEMNEKIVYLSQIQQLDTLEQRIDERKKTPSYKESKKKQYYIGVAQDFLERERIFNDEI